jgi:hypothetical protein
MVWHVNCRIQKTDGDSVRGTAAASWLAFLRARHPGLVVRLKEDVPDQDDLDPARQRDAAPAPRTG